MNTIFLKTMIGKRPVRFPQNAEGQQIGKRGENRLVAESFNALGQLILSIRDKYWRKMGEGEFGSHMRRGVEMVRV